MGANNQIGRNSSLLGAGKAALGLAAALGAATLLTPSDSYAKKQPENKAPECNISAQVPLDSDNHALLDLGQLCSDPEGNAISYATNSPNARMNANQLEITAPGSVSLRASDNYGASNQYTFNAVAPAAQPAGGMSLDSLMAGGGNVVLTSQPAPAPVAQPASAPAGQLAVQPAPAPVAQPAPALAAQPAGFGSLDAAISGEASAPAASAGPVEPVVPEPTQPTQPVEPTVAEPATPTTPTQPTQPAQSGSPVSGCFFVGMNIHGDGNDAIVYPNYVGGSLNVGDLQLRLAGIGGYQMPGTPGYSSELWGTGFALGSTIPLLRAGTLDLDMAYLHNEGEFSARSPLDEFENVVPDIDQSENAVGVELGWLLGDKGWLGSLHLDFGYAGRDNSRHQTIDETTTEHVEEGPTVDNPAPGVSIYQYTEMDITQRLVHVYDGEETQDSYGFSVLYLSPDIADTGLQLGIGGGIVHNDFSSDADHTFTNQVDITGQTTVRIDTPDGSEEDVQPINVHEVDVATADEPHMGLEQESGFIDIVGQYQRDDLFWDGFNMRAAGLLRIHVDEDLQDDESRAEGAFSLQLHIPEVMNIAGNYWRAARQHMGNVMILGAGTDEDAIANYFTTMTNNMFGFQPQEIDQMRLQLANAQLMNSLDGILVGWTGRTGDVSMGDDHMENRIYLGWGFAPVAVVAQYSHPTNEISAGVTIKDSVLKIGSLTLGIGRSDIEDYNAHLLFTAYFGNEGDEE